MKGKKIAIILISIISVAGIGFLIFNRLKYKSGNPEKDNRKINIFRTETE